MVVASPRTVTFIGRERPCFVWTTTATCARTPAGTTALSAVAVASVTCAFVVPKKTEFDGRVLAEVLAGERHGLARAPRSWA